MALIKHTDPEPLSAWSPLASWRWLDDLFHTSDGHQLIRVEESVRDGVMVVRAEVPGMDPEKDVTVTVESGALHIRAQRTQEEESAGERWLRREFATAPSDGSSPCPRE